MYTQSRIMILNRMYERHANIQEKIHFNFLTVDLISIGAWYGGPADEPGSNGTSRGHDRGSALLRTEARGTGQSCHVVPQGKSINVPSMKEACSLII